MKGPYNNEMRNIRSAHKSGGGSEMTGVPRAKGSSEKQAHSRAKGSKEMSAHAGGKCKPANFGSASKFLGGEVDGSLESVGQSRMGGEKPAKVSLKKGSKGPGK